MEKISQEYRQLRSLNRDIRNTKKRLINSIMKLVKPFMWKTGYVTNKEKGRPSFDKGNSRPLLAYFFADNKYYKPKLSFTLSAANEYTGIAGFTENNAVITDAYAGALVTNGMDGMPIEDLINLWAWVERNTDKFNSQD